MTVESNYVIAIATLSDWLKRLGPASFSTNETQNQNQSHHVRVIFPALQASYRKWAMSNHVAQNRHTGEQMTHWDILNKENSNLLAFFNMSQCVICSPVWRFCTTCLVRCKRPIARNCHWFIALPAPVVIGRSNCFGFGFSTVI